MKRMQPGAALRTTDLVQDAKHGDLAALGELFERYYPRVKKVVRLRLGTWLRSRIESNDIMQDTFVNALRAFERFEMRDEASLVNWLSKIAQHTITRLFERESAEARNPDREVPLYGQGTEARDLALADPAPGPEEAVAGREESSRLEACVRRLPEAHREVIVLRDYVGFAWREVAEEMGLGSADAARMTHLRARLKLESWLRRLGGGPRTAGTP